MRCTGHRRPASGSRWWCAESVRYVRASRTCPRTSWCARFWNGCADMMHRNLDRRVEVMAQVKDPRLTAQLDEMFESTMDPATRCWELQADGRWNALPLPGQTVRDHQVALMARHRSP